MSEIDEADIDYAIEIPEVYDGAAIYVMRDGRWINRFADWPGMEHRAARVDAYIQRHHADGEAR